MSALPVRGTVDVGTSVPGGGTSDASALNQTTEIARLTSILAEAVKIALQTFDVDTGAGTATAVGLAQLLPASGGPVVGGTATNPIRTDPTGTTAQPITDNGGSLTVDGSLSVAAVGGATPTLANVAGSATSVTLLASNANRKAAVIVNDSTAILYVKYGSSASTTSFAYVLAAGDTLEISQNNLYTGIITGIWASATGSARCTEVTA